MVRVETLVILKRGVFATVEMVVNLMVLLVPPSEVVQSLVSQLDAPSEVVLLLVLVVVELWLVVGQID